MHSGAISSKNVILNINRIGIGIGLPKLDRLFIRNRWSGHKLTYKDYGDPKTVIRKEGQHVDSVPDNKILVKMLAAPMNPADINTVQGTYPIKPKKFPAVPGMEGVGIVLRAATASDDTKSGHGLLKEGQWVIPRAPGMGTYQYFIVAENDDFIPIPQMDLVSAATISVNPCTAYRMLKDFENLNPGDTVIQNGGNSGVGQAVIQLCREFGYKSISMIRPRDNFDEVKARLESLGNKDTIILPDDEGKSIRGLKCQLAFNCVGGKSATDLLRVLDEGRTMVTYGGMSRQPVIIPTSHLIFNDIKIEGYWMTRWNAKNTLERREQMLGYLSELMLRGKWKHPTHKLIPFAKYRDALENCMKPYQGLKYILTFD